ncbi:MAG: ATP-binding cassette domain-containing protein [Lachnospiraceae bacterium]|nr:ATP-binding cassette domain-containing protein [Lachnospiraceae bacterium]
MAQITCKDLILGYDRNVLTSGVSFEVIKGDYIMVLGPKRSGKSMLLECLAGITKPMGGSISLGDGIKRNKIAYMPQQMGLSKDSTVTVKEFCLSGCLSGGGFHPFFTSKDRTKTEEMLERAEIADLKDRAIADLSGGQQKRVFLARTFLTSADIYLLDEPAAGLDIAAVSKVYSLIERMNREEKVSIVIVPKNIEFAAESCSHVLMLGEDGFYQNADDYFM